MLTSYKFCANIKILMKYIENMEKLKLDFHKALEHFTVRI